MTKLPEWAEVLTFALFIAACAVLGGWAIIQAGGVPMQSISSTID